MLPPATFSPALLSVADRLGTILMVLADAIPLAGSTPAFPAHVARTLFFRLSRLVIIIVRVCTFGIPKPRRPATPKADPPASPRPTAPRTPGSSLPRRPGWLLDALPGAAPTVAADLAALLADPALAPLLAAVPGLDRILRPVLRSLGLTQHPSPPEAPRQNPLEPPQPPHPSHPRPAARPTSAPARPPATRFESTP